MDPLSDVTKAEPDLKLVGTWENKKKDGLRPLTIDVPTVKGNPKGLMRAYNPGGGEVWFFVTRIGTETYANVMFDKTEKGAANLNREGDFAKWNVAQAKRFVVVHYSLAGDEVTVNMGDDKAYDAVIRKEGFEVSDAFPKAPPEWLAKYLEKNGPGTLFPAKTAQTMTRVKKK
jgi:hypothetical protein